MENICTYYYDSFLTDASKCLEEVPFSVFLGGYRSSSQGGSGVGDFIPWGYLTPSRDIFGCHEWVVYSVPGNRPRSQQMRT